MMDDILKKTGAEYRRTLNHNYLVIKKSKEDEEDYELDISIDQDRRIFAGISFHGL